MSVHYFPENDPDFPGIISYSPLHRTICQSKPFGDISAEEYLEFAREDLKRGEKCGLVNALSNAKRCFHYQIDRLLFRFGLRQATVATGFPVKLDLLSDLKILSGTLLRVFNRERNAMEHDYTAPTKEMAEGSIDLCELLLLATERFLTEVPTTLRVVLDSDERDLLLQLEPGANRLQKFIISGTTINTTDTGSYYGGNIYKFGTNDLEDGITISSIPQEDIELNLNNKDFWMPYLRMFAASTREKRHKQYPDETLVTFEHVLPWEKVKAAFEDLTKSRS